MTSPLSSLSRIARTRPAPTEAERCDMCAESIVSEHSHVVDVDARHLMCVCRPCYLLFTEESATQRYRAVPDRYLSFPTFELAPGRWDSLQIPVGLAFFFRSSTTGRISAFYPSPVGATESELPASGWNEIIDPQLLVLRDDVEALLVRVPATGAASCHLVPIDACYELVGRIRLLWKGFDGGRDVRTAIDEFFDVVDRKSRPAP